MGSVYAYIDNSSIGGVDDTLLSCTFNAHAITFLKVRSVGIGFHD